MTGLWDLKVIAPEPLQAQKVASAFIQRFLGRAEITGIEVYDKFDTPMYTVDIRSGHDAGTTLEDMESLFQRMGKPLYFDHGERVEQGRRIAYYEGILDSREDGPVMPDIFWIRLYVEKHR